MALTRMFGWRALEWVWGDQPQVRLKNKYGSGFRITMNTDPKLTSEAKRCDGHERPCMLRQPLTGVRRRYVRERMRRVCVCGESGRAGRWLSYIESILPAGFSLLDDFASSVTYEFPLHDGAVARVFDAMTQHAQQHGILDWGLSQTRYCTLATRRWGRPQRTGMLTAATMGVAVRWDRVGGQPRGRVFADHRRGRRPGRLTRPRACSSSLSLVHAATRP